MAVSAPPPDAAPLASRAAAGDDVALGQLLAAHETRAYNVAYRLLGREADARDAVQDASLLALRALRGDGAPPRDVGRFGPWFLRVVANAALGQLRRRPSVPPVSVDALAGGLPAPARLEPEREAQRRE